MNGQVLLQLVQIADVVDALLEAAHVTRGQTHPFDTQTLQLRRDDGVFDCRGRVRRFVDGDFQLGRDVFANQVTVHFGDVRDGRTILDGGSSDGLRCEV